MIRSRINETPPKIYNPGTPMIVIDHISKNYVIAHAYEPKTPFCQFLGCQDGLHVVSWDRVNVRKGSSRRSKKCAICCNTNRMDSKIFYVCCDTSNKAQPIIRILRIPPKPWCIIKEIKGFSFLMYNLVRLDIIHKIYKSRFVRFNVGWTVGPTSSYFFI